VEDDERSSSPRSYRTGEGVEKVQNLVHSGERLRINRACYMKIVKRLREAVRRKRPELWPNAWILHHDNAPAHKALSVKQFLAKKSITEMEHSLYSSGLSPNNF
jgi:hypothetical protein